MNKIYKVIWSKSKNMYVAVSEYAKSHTKSPQSRLIDKTVVAGVLACVISCGAVLPVYAAGTGSYTANNGSADGKQSIAIGTGTKANTDYDVILGRNSTANDINNVIIIGKGSSVSNNPVAFSSSLDGYQIVGSYSGAVLIGNDASVSLENSTGRFMLGDSYGTSANGTDMTVVVPEDYSKISHVVGIGDNVKIGDMDTVAVGFGARATSKSATAVGHGANAKGENSIALGTSANSTSVLSSALGWGSFATGMGSTALGTNSGTKGSYDIALGFDADISSTKGSNTAIGFNTSVKNNATNAIAVGTLANVTENNGIAIGRYANSQASNGIALGQRSLAKASSSVAIGANSVAVNDDVVSFGHGAYDPRISESLIQYNLMRDGEELGLMKTEISMSDQITNNPQEYKRRLIHVADGINDSDVATVGQLTHFVGINVPNDEDNGIFASSQGNYAGEGAVGLNSVAIGANTVVNPDNSIAIGNNNNVSNVKNSVVLGNDNTVSNSYEDYEIAGNYSDVVLIGNKVVADRGYGVPRYSSDNAGYGIDETNHIITLPGEEPKIGRVVGIGDNVKIGDEYSVAIGSNTSAKGLSSLAIGHGANGNDVASVALGTMVNASEFSSAIGFGANAAGLNSVAISNASTKGDYDLAAGFGTTITSSKGKNIAIGFNNAVSGTAVNSITMGTNASVSKENAVSIGSYSSSVGEKAVSIGYDAMTKGTNSVAIGSGSVAQEDNVVSFGRAITDESPFHDDIEYSTIMGDDGSFQVMGLHMGFDDTRPIELKRRLINVADGIEESDVATIGQLKANSSHFVGVNVPDDDFGYGASSQGNYTGNGATGYSAIAIGPNATSTMNSSIATGNEASAKNLAAVSYGWRSSSEGQGSVALGSTSQAKGDFDVAVGFDSKITSTKGYNVAIGTGNQVTSSNAGSSVAIGSRNYISSQNAIVIGTSASSVSENGIAIGKYATVNSNSTGSVALGSNSFVVNGENDVVSFGNRGDEVPYEESNGSYQFSDMGENGLEVMDTGPAGTIYVYKPDPVEYKRRLIHVADGINDSDVATVGQLKANSTHFVGVGSTDVDNDNYLGGGATALNSIAVGKSASGTGESSIAIGTSARGNDVMSNAIGWGTSTIGKASTTIGSLSSSKGNFNVAVGFDTNITSTNVNNIAIGTGSSITGNSTGNAILLGANTSVKNSEGIAIGSKVNVSGSNSIAIGADSSASGNSSVAIGSSSVVESGESGVVSFGHSKHIITGLGDETSYNFVEGDDGEVVVEKSVVVTTATITNNPQEFKRRLIHVADGLTASDVATVGQVRTVSAGNGLEIAETDNVNGSKNEAFSIKAGTNVTVDENGVNVIGDGTVASGNTGLVTGGKLYSEGRLTSNGNYAKKGKSIAQNITLLDTQLKATDSSAIKDLSIDGNTITFTKGDGTTGTLTGSFTGSSNGDISYDTNNPDTITFNGTKGTKLTNLKQGTLSATSTDAVTGAQLYATNQNIVGFSSDISRNKNNIRELNSSISNTLEMVSSTNGLIDNLSNMKADSSLNNLTSAGRQVIQNMANSAVQNYLRQNGFVANPVAPTAYNANTLTVNDAGNGSLYVGEGSNVNGSSSIAIGVGNQVNANNSGAFGDPSIINADASYVLGNDDTINTGATGSFVVGNDSVSSAKGGLTFGSNNVLEDTAENSIALGNNVTVSGMNSVALGSNSTATEDNIISVGNDTVKRRITNVSDGNIADGSTDVITGSQLFATNERVKANEDAITTKANVDASNINVDDWTAKLGTGTVSEGNTGLVTGGNVFTAIQTASSNNLIQSVDNVINIGGNIGGSTINVANKDGEGRVITGVITNPDDPTSATNVGYVDAVNTNLANAVNQSFYNMNDKMNKLGANAAAMASLTPATFEGDEKWSLSAGVGHYHGETAGAIGAFYRPAENVMMNVRGSFGNDENMLGAAVSVSLSKGDIPGVTKRQLANKVTQLEQVHMQDHALIVQQNQQIAELQAAVREMREQINNK